MAPWTASVLESGMLTQSAASAGGWGFTDLVIDDIERPSEN